MKIIIAGDKGSGKTTLAKIILKEMDGQAVYIGKGDIGVQYIDPTWNLLVDNIILTQTLIDEIEELPNNMIITTINFSTDAIKTTIPVFALQQIPRYRMQPQDQILEMVS